MENFILTNSLQVVFCGYHGSLFFPKLSPQLPHNITQNTSSQQTNKILPFSVGNKNPIVKKNKR